VTEIRWHPDAVVAVKAAVDFGAVRWPSEADDLAIYVLAAVEQLQMFPYSGREGRVQGTRELVLSKYPLTVVYVARPDVVEVLDVVHQRQKWPIRPQDVE
jgi:toxin ParE1/3/4